MIAAALCFAALSPALAQQTTAPAEPKTWLDALKLTAYIDAGINFATENPRDEIAFGHSFTDRSGRPVVNQAGFVLERPIDPAAETLDLGFKLHAFYGTDARYTHFLGLFDRGPKSLYQLDVVDANFQAHVPWGFAPVSTDLKLGAYATPLGLEVIDPRGNFFYSKSYIFSYGLPFKHLGLLTTTHAASFLDIYAGVDTGTNTGIGRSGDNNGAAAFVVGIGLNLFEGKLAVLALTHTGPETPRAFEGFADTDSEARSFNDVLVTWKISDALTSITELNYVKDDAAAAEAYGVAQYFTYALSERLTVGIRGELFRDDDGFFVFRAPGRRDVANILGGRTVEDPRSGSTGGPNTYGAVTLGLNWKPALGYAPVEGLVIRPEVRYDRAFLDDLAVRPFDGGTKRSQVTLGVDVVIPFSIF
jgi:hypothetical protein